MAYGLNDFCREASAALGRDPGPEGQKAVVAAVKKLLADKAFLAETFPADLPLGIRKIYKDPKLGFCVIAHNYGDRPQGRPHDHGETWAIYGQADRFTDMIEWKRLDDESVAGQAKVEKTKTYRVKAGDAFLYPARRIHSVAWPEGARLIRVTGADLDDMPRRRFDESKGTVTEGLTS